MQQSKILISQALSLLRSNMHRTGDPLGLKKNYWTDWLEGQKLPTQGDTIFLTGRMYQMLPYILQATAMSEVARPLLPLLSLKIFSKMAEMGNRVAGETILRFKARQAREIQSKGEDTLKGILAALQCVGQTPAYLYAQEPYSGVLLYDLGLKKDAADHAEKVYQQFHEKGIKRVITVDPHTTFMLREIYPECLDGYKLEVQHYLEVLQEKEKQLGNTAESTLPNEFVIHDSCVMTRDLGLVEQIRGLARQLGIQLHEPENSGQNTACCGGPVEYAYSDLSNRVSSIRIRELAGVCQNILVMCPICLINLMKYEQELGVRVWDMGEILSALLDCRSS